MNEYTRFSRVASASLHWAMVVIAAPGVATAGIPADPCAPGGACCATASQDLSEAAVRLYTILSGESGQSDPFAMIQLTDEQEVGFIGARARNGAVRVAAMPLTQSGGRDRSPIAEWKHELTAPPQLAVAGVARIARRVPPEQTEVVLWPGLEGLALDLNHGAILLPDELVAAQLVDERGRVHLAAAAAYAQNLPDRSDAFTKAMADRDAAWAVVHVRETASDGISTWPTNQRARASRIMRKREDLLDAASRAGQYLAQAVDDDGRFIYIYDARTGRTPADYNILRHAGAAYSMLELYQFAPEPGLLDAAERALEHLVAQIQPAAGQYGSAAWVVERGSAKLGGNALAILAFAKHSELHPERPFLTTAQRLANWIIAVQSPDGEFLVHKQDVTTGQIDRFRSDYYPGEAMLALVRLYELDADERWLAAAQRAAEFELLRMPDRIARESSVPHDHWLLYALNALHKHRPDPKYAECTAKIVESICKPQHREEFPEHWRGAWGSPPRITPVATRVEGLMAAHDLLIRAGHSNAAQRAFSTAAEAGNFLIRNQLSAASGLFRADPARTDGAFQAGLLEAEVRIDYVQHAISALLGLARANSVPKSMPDGFPLGEAPSQMELGTGAPQSSNELSAE